MVERYHRLFLKALEALQRQRRLAPAVVVRNAGQVNVAGQQVNVNAGLGFIINQATQFNQNDVIFVALLVYTILGLLTDWLVRRLERRALGWRRGLVVGA